MPLCALSESCVFFHYHSKFCLFVVSLPLLVRTATPFPAVTITHRCICCDDQVRQI